MIFQGGPLDGFELHPDPSDGTRIEITTGDAGKGTVYVVDEGRLIPLPLDINQGIKQ